MSRLANLGEEGGVGEGWTGLLSAVGLRFRATSTGPTVGSMVGLGGCGTWAGDVGWEPGFGAIGGLTPSPALGLYAIPEAIDGFGGTGGGM